jgi:cellobiose-specific phosphotransferase system component IIA
LERLLRDRSAEIWKAALDGLVMFGGQAALEALVVAKATVTEEQREWIDEAVGQIIEAHRPGQRAAASRRAARAHRN